VTGSSVTESFAKSVYYIKKYNVCAGFSRGWSRCTTQRWTSGTVPITASVHQMCAGCWTLETRWLSAVRIIALIITRVVVTGVLRCAACGAEAADRVDCLLVVITGSSLVGGVMTGNHGHAEKNQPEENDVSQQIFFSPSIKYATSSRFATKFE